MIKNISKQLHLQEAQVKNTMELLESGATIPFIARYRKEKTNQLDEVQIKAIRDLQEQLIALEKEESAYWKAYAKIIFLLRNSNKKSNKSIHSAN